MPVTLISPEQAREYEPHVRCVAALRVETTGIVDFVGVCDVLAAQIEQGGGQVRLGTEIVGVDGRFDGVTVGRRPRARSGRSSSSTAPGCTRTGWPGWPG